MQNTPAAQTVKPDINRDISTRRVIDSETGEIFTAKVIMNPELYTVQTEESKQQRKQFAQRKHRKDTFDKLADGFTFSYIDKVSELHHDERFTDDEKTRIMFLGTYVSYSEKGSFLTFSNGRYVYKHHLKELLEIANQNKFYSFYNKLVAAGIIAEVPEEPNKKKLKWSDEYHFKGKLPAGIKAEETGLLKTYDKQIQELYKAKNEEGKAIHSPKQLYTVFMLLPFVHYETNIICRYPNKPFTECEPLEFTEIAQGLGFNRSNDLKRKLQKISLKEQPVFKLDMTGKNTYVIVNPFVVWRQKKAPEASLLVAFYDTAVRIAKEKGIYLTMRDLLETE